MGYQTSSLLSTLEILDQKKALMDNEHFLWNAYHLPGLTLFSRAPIPDTDTSLNRIS
jgi:hypothetical protein